MGCAMETSAPSRPTCPHCGATVHVGMTWCTLCYRPLDTPDGPDAADEADAPDDADALDEGDDSAERDDSDEGDDGDAHRDEAARHVAPPPDVEALADQMLARLAASADAPLGDGLGDRLSSRVPQSTSAKVGFTAGAGVAGCLLLLLALWLLGLLL